ncbi:MAG: hypothetical protein ACRDX8_14745 [Acidimicrobiales bacterium]
MIAQFRGSKWQVLRQFPPTDEGWEQAWHSLRALNYGAADVVARAIGRLSTKAAARQAAAAPEFGAAATSQGPTSHQAGLAGPAKFCSACGNGLIAQAVVCPRCGSYASGPGVLMGSRSRTTAILLAVFLSFWTWVYTYRWNAWKFWTAVSVDCGLLILALATPFSAASIFFAILWWIALLVFYIWAIVDAATTPEAAYQTYPWREMHQRY